MMRIITCNLNGIRSATRKGFFQWVIEQHADVICLQETKFQTHQFIEAMKLSGYAHYFFDAQKKGYSGVGIYCKGKPDRIQTGLGWSVADQEGRYIQLDFQNISVASLYIPSGTSGQERQTIKYEFLDQYYLALENHLKTQRNLIVCGDWNIAHKEIDLENWRSNQKCSGFLPQERAWLDRVLGQDCLGYVDAFRVVNQQDKQYTWWSNFGRAWENNVGWRIDYQIVTPQLRESVRDASIYRTEKFSDHAPLVMDYELKLFD
jgi:exodeoxyribonuclease III